MLIQYRKATLCDTWIKVFSDNSNILMCFKPIIPSFSSDKSSCFLSTDSLYPFIMWFKTTGALLWGIKGQFPKSPLSPSLWFSPSISLSLFNFPKSCLCLSGFLLPSLWLSFTHSLSTQRERKREKGMTERCNKELLILSMEESESAGRKQEVRFQVIDQTGWHEEMLVC